MNIKFSNTILGVGILTVLLLSCKKEELPDVQENNPVFHLSFTDDQGDVKSINAGDEDWVLETGKSDFLGFTSSYGSFINERTNAYFRVDYFYDQDHALAGNYNSLSDHFSLFEIPNALVEKFIFEGDLDNVQSVQWSVNGSEYAPVNLYEIQEPGQYQICLKVKFSEGCIRTLCNTFYLGVPNQIYARYDVVSNNTEKNCTANIAGNYDEIKWYVDGNYYGQGHTINIDSLGQGFHEVSMRVFKNGNETGRWNELLSSGSVLCDLQCFDIVSKLQGEIHSGVVISYRNEAGELYYSTLADQSNANLEVSEIELYDDRNEQGQEVIRFLLQGSVGLENLNGEAIELTNIQSKTGLAL